MKVCPLTVCVAIAVCILAGVCVGMTFVVPYVPFFRDHPVVGPLVVIFPTGIIVGILTGYGLTKCDPEVHH